MLSSSKSSFRGLSLWIVLLAALATGLATALSSHACRYNVRDLGFVDLESQVYQLILADLPTLTQDRREKIARIAEGALLDSNVILAGKSSDTAPGLVRADSAVLRSPDGDLLGIALGGAIDGAELPPGLEDLLASLTTSPTRETLVRHASEGFAALLLVEGTDPLTNRRAREIASESIEQVRGQMASLPKPIAHPPAVVPLTAPEFARERVLLWSLGFGTNGPGPEPTLAIVYGRARRIGPLLRGEAITTARIHHVLATIGADCECGLDLSWTRGKPLPVRWPASVHTRVVKGLGFDPESPRVKLEAAQILGKRATAITPSIGYREIDLDAPAANHAAPNTSPSPTEAATPTPSDASPPTALPQAPAPPEPPERLPRNLLLAFGGLGLLALGIGLWIFLRSQSTPS
jgi:hypothetical protein